MNKTFWIGLVVVYVVMQCVGFLVHGVWLSDTYAPLYGTVFRPEPEFQGMMWVIFVTGAVTTFLFCYIFTKGYEGKGLAEGLRYGLLIGLLMSVPMLDQYVLYPLSLNLTVTWFLTGVINFMIGGAVLAAIYRPSAPATAAAAA
ncbi:MAG: hypothetical protein ACREVN_08835 [Gammaproteobacteria bacterium]